MSESKNQNEFSLIDFWQMVKRNNLFIIIVSSLFFLIFSIYVWLIATPNYISNADVMVQVEQDSGTSNDPNYDLVNAFRLIDTVAELMEKEIVLNNAKQKLELLGYSGITIQSLREGLIVASSSSSYFINISFINEDVDLAKDSVDSIIDAVIEETDVIDAFPVLTNKIRRTSFASDAVYYSPNKIIFSIAGALIGITISIGYSLIKETVSSRFKSKEEIENSLNIQVLGVIPKKIYKEKKNAKKKKYSVKK